MLYKLVLLLAFTLLFPGGTAQNSTTGCMPASCTARCDPACSSGQVCTLGTMTQCGVCPASRCIDKSILNPSSSSSAGAGSATQSVSNDSNGGGGGDGSNGALIGGLVGGLVGGALVFAVLGYCVIKRNKSNVPSLTPFLSQQQQQQMQQGFNPFNGNQNQQMTTREANSGVISVAYVPPDRSSHRQSTQLQTSQAGAGSRRHSSYLSVRDNRTSYYDTDDETLETTSQRTSLASSVSNQPTTPAKASQAIQVVRARPQIMRVNQVRIDSGDGSSAGGLSRSGSVRTILTREDDPSISSVQLSRSRTAPTRRLANRSKSSSMLVITPQERRNTIINVEDDHIDRSMLSVGTPSISVDNSFDIRTATNLSTPADENPFHDRHSVDGSLNAKIQSITEMQTGGESETVSTHWNRE